jgi:hypothetical protein
MKRAEISRMVWDVLLLAIIFSFLRVIDFVSRGSPRRSRAFHFNRKIYLLRCHMTDVVCAKTLRSLIRSIVNEEARVDRLFLSLRDLNDNGGGVVVTHGYFIKSRRKYANIDSILNNYRFGIGQLCLRT